MVAWFDPSDSSTLSLVSGFASALNDKSGNGRNLSQVIEANRPSSTTLNGLTALAFDGSNDWLNSSLNVPNSGLNVPGLGTTIFSVIKPSSTAQTGAAVFVSGTVSSSPRRAGMGLASGTGADGYNVTINNAGSFSTRYSASGLNTDAQVLWAVIGTSAITSIGTNRAELSATAASGGSVVGNQNDLAIGAVNTNGSSSRQFNGTIGEVLIYKAELTASQLSAVQNYLIGKWKL
jgi:hypothetical protein